MKLIDWKNPEHRFQVNTWVLALVALVGVWLNIYKLKSCFYIWAFTNAGWTIVDWKRRIYAQSVLHAVYFISAIWGIIVW